MHLGFHYHIPATQRENHIYMPGYLGRFIDGLADHCEDLSCFLHSPTPYEINQMDYRIRSGNVHLVDIGPHASVIERTLTTKKFTSFLKRYVSELDLLLVRGPSPLLPAMVSASPVPTALLLVGDYMAGINDLNQPRWRKEAIRLWAYWNKLGQDRACRNSLVFVNSRILYGQLQDKALALNEIRTTTLTQEDFFIRSDTCQSKPYHLLYVGRINRAKGLLQMVQAVSLLTKRGEDVILDIVGWPASGDPILDEIQVLANAENIAERVHYHGLLPLGPELFECYKRADIFLIASLSSFEGFPRVIWEAMAHSLPVVASRVGSIPAFIEGAAELIQPGQVNLLVEAIVKLIHRPDVRQEYIMRGLELAHSNTLETQIGAMVQIIKSWLDDCRG